MLRHEIAVWPRIGETFAEMYLIRPDIQAAATVVARRNPAVDIQTSRLQRADLTGADLSNAHLAGASLAGVDFTGADLTGADLMWADFTDAAESGPGRYRAANMPLSCGNITKWSYGDSNSGPLACHATLTAAWTSLDEAGLAVDLRESGLEESGRRPVRLQGGYQNYPQAGP